MEKKHLQKQLERIRKRFLGGRNRSSDTGLESAWQNDRGVGGRATDSAISVFSGAAARPSSPYYPNQQSANGRFGRTAVAQGRKAELQIAVELGPSLLVESAHLPQTC